MRTVRFTLRRSYIPEGGTKDDKVYYGNSTETVESGANKGKEVPCIEVKYELGPQNVDELVQNIGGDKNWDKFVDLIFTTLLKDKIRADIFLKAGDEEKTEEGRRKILQKVEQLADNFTIAEALAETLTAKSALDEINSPEMQSLAAENPAEFARRVKSILASTRGVTVGA